MPTFSIQKYVETIVAQGLERGPFLVWYDESRNLKPLIQRNVPENTNFIEFNGSYLEIRQQIDRSPQAFLEKLVIYVPEKPLEPSWLLQYEILGQKVQQTLPDIIKQMGIALTQEIKVLLSLPSGKNLISIWDEILELNLKPTSVIILDALLAKSLNIDIKLDMKDVILQTILNPDFLLEKIRKEGLFEHFKLKLKQRGITLHEGETNEEIALVLVTSTFFSQLPKYNITLLQNTLADLIPKDKHLKFWQEVFEEWKTNPQCNPKIIDYGNQIKEKYQIIEKLSACKLSELMNVEIVPDFENYLLERMQAQFLAQQSTSFADKLSLIQNLYNERKTKFRLISGENSTWETLGLAAILNSQIENSNQELKEFEKNAPKSTQLIQNYAGKTGWWQIDETYLKLIARAKKPYEEWIKSDIFDKVINAYANWLDHVNRLWTGVIIAEKKWSQDLPLIPTKIWKKVLKLDQQKAAVLFIDAFRTDIAWKTVEKLILAKFFDVKNDEIKNHQFFSGLPTITRVGMLLPLTQTDELFSLEKKEETLDFRFHDTPMNTKEDRKGHIQKNLGKNVDFIELLDLIKKTKAELTTFSEEKKVLFVYYKEIDDNGNAIINNPGIVEEFLNNILNSIQKLIEVGFRRIFLIPDHGFLIYPDNFSPQSIPIPSKQDNIIKDRRFALGFPTDFGEHTSIVKLNLSDFGFQSDLVALFPIGIHQFIVPGDKPKFDHGGLSLQENALTLIEIKVKEKKLLNPVKIDIDFPENITTPKVIIKLNPINFQVTNIARVVIIKAFNASNLESQIGCSKIINIQFNSIMVDLKLQQLPKNVQIRVFDEQTGEILGEKTIPVLLAGYDDIL